MEIPSVTSFLDYYKRIKMRTIAVINCIPEEYLDWTFKKGKYTLADQVRHIATIERYMFAETIAGRRSLYQGCGKELANGYHAVKEMFWHLNAETIEILAQLTNEDLQGKCRTPDGAEITVWKWMRAMVEHEIHHRGQIYLYLSMLGIETPPIFGLTAEQVRERSLPNNG